MFAIMLDRKVMEIYHSITDSHDSDDPIYPIAKLKMPRLPESRKNVRPENTLVGGDSSFQGDARGAESIVNWC